MKLVQYGVNVSCLVAITVMLVGCGLTPTTDKQALCAKLQRQVTYYNSNRNIEASMSTPWQRQALQQQLKDNHCH